MLTIVNNVMHVDLLVQEKRRESFMYFCTHEHINVLFLPAGYHFKVTKYRYLPLDSPYQAYLIQ
jgi:hypothetical protein